MQNNFQKIPLILSILFLGVSLTVLGFLYRQVDKRNTKTDLATTEWQNEVARRNEIRTLNNSIKVIEQDRMSLETHFARSSDIVPFLDTIEALAPKSGAKAEVVAVDALKDNSGLTVSLNVEGSFQAVYKFLMLLENSPYELQFNSVDIRRRSIPESLPGKTASSPVWEGVFDIKLLSFVP